MLANAHNRRWTVPEIDRMVEVGILRADDPLELIDGDLVHMPPQGPIHAFAKDRIRRRLDRAFGDGRFVKDQVPIACGDNSLPEPDISVTTVELADRHPLGSETVLVVEIANTSAEIDRQKAAVYARAGVPVYWLVNLPDRRVEVHEHPGPDRYHLVSLLDDTLDIVVPELGLRWPVAELLP